MILILSELSVIGVCDGSIESGMSFGGGELNFKYFFISLDIFWAHCADIF